MRRRDFFLHSTSLCFHLVYWLNYPAETGRYDELCYSFSISNGLTQMVNFPTWFSNCDCHSLAILVLILSSNPNIHSTIAFLPWRITDHVIVSLLSSFKHKRVCLISSYSWWLFLCGYKWFIDHLRDVSWKEIFKLHVFRIGVCTLDRKYPASKAKFR